MSSLQIEKSIFERESVDIWERLETESRPIVLYGTGNGADKIIDILNGRNIKISGIFSSSDFVRERYFRGYKVTDYETCKKRFPDMLILMCFGSSRKEVLDNVKNMSLQNEVLAPDVPVYGDNIFNREFFETHKDELLQVRNFLCDKKSIETFDNAVEFKLTGKIEKLFLCEYDKDGLFDISDKCVYLDLGAYNGDTAIEFYEKYPNSEIIAVEPDKRNFGKLCENTQHIKNINCIRALVGNKTGTVKLDTNKGRGVHESDNGKSEVSALTVESIIKNKKLSETEQLIIKADVEGNELATIEGAKSVLQKYNPLMFISCYHRSEDYFTLVKKVFEYNNSYSLYMRHYCGIPAWETEFIFVPR